MAAITRQWLRRLVNAYEVKAGMVYFQCNNCVIYNKRFIGELLTVGRHTNLSSFSSLSRVSILLLTRDIDIVILSVRPSVRLSVRLSVCP